MTIDIVYQNINMSYPMLYIGYSGIWIYSIMLKMLLRCCIQYVCTALHGKSYVLLRSNLRDTRWNILILDRFLSFYLSPGPSISVYIRLNPFWPVWAGQRGAISIYLSPATPPDLGPWGMTQYSQNQAWKRGLGNAPTPSPLPPCPRVYKLRLQLSKNIISIDL